jgi:hypothetical protein
MIPYFHTAIRGEGLWGAEADLELFFEQLLAPQQLPRGSVSAAFAFGSVRKCN